MSFIFQAFTFISTIQYSLILNKGIFPGFVPSCGLRQGDPLSSYLSILGSEALIRLINKEVDQNDTSPMKVANNALVISKLCYADDIILFCKAKIFELTSLKMWLEKYYSWSGELINEMKFGVFPSRSVSS